jgi:hypothetical protein
MFHFLNSLFDPMPGQSVTVGSITWIINTDGNREIVQSVQDAPEPIVPPLAPQDLISGPPLW